MVKYDLTKPSAAFGEPHFPAECRCCFDNGSLYDGVEAISEAGGDSAHENKLHLSLTRMLLPQTIQKQHLFSPLKLIAPCFTPSSLS